MKSWLAALLILTFPLLVGAQPAIRDLGSEIEAGRVQLEALRGNGSSSGSSIVGELVNQTQTSIRIEVHMTQPVFLVNRGRGQNMVASAVYLEGGRYMKTGGRSFIELRPRARVQVTLIAYCADFHKENPSSGDQLGVAQLPDNLKVVMSKIQAHSRANPNEDITVAAQAAVWLVQGIAIREIRKRFPVTREEERLARAFLP